jgi:uncharacterized CHY-type Zn-finger protein
MSTLLNSLIIEPVIRHARRFSRNLGDTATRLDPAEHDQLFEHDSSSSRGSSATRSDSQHEHLNIDNDEVLNRTLSAEVMELHMETDFGPDSISGVPLVESPSHEDRSFDSDVAGLLDSESISQRTTAPLAHDMSLDVQTTSLSSVPQPRHVPSLDSTGRFDLRARQSQASVDSLTATMSTISHAATTTAIGPLEGPSRRSSRADSRSTNSRLLANDTRRARGNTLPEDDGQTEMRRKITAIREMDISGEEKAKLMHNIMTESYNKVHKPQHQQNPRAVSPASMQGVEGGLNPQSPSSLSSATFPNADDNPYNIFPEDLLPDYCPLQPYVLAAYKQASEESKAAASTDTDVILGEPPRELGCQHYKRNVKLQCSTCSRWYTCRFCHDDVEDHKLIRTETKNMLCMLCGHPQPAGEKCVHCNESSAYYYCDKCKLWDDDNLKSIYHCNDCGICRTGRGLGKDFFHCKVCLPLHSVNEPCLQDLDMWRLHVNITPKCPSLH